MEGHCLSCPNHDGTELVPEFQGPVGQRDTKTGMPSFFRSLAYASCTEHQTQPCTCQLSPGNHYDNVSLVPAGVGQSKSECPSNRSNP
eukprot:1022310-Amphidinium_carterae.1